MRLRRATIDGPGISRRRRGRGFSYDDARGPVTDPETLDRIRSLAIPPAWTDVWICPDPSGHIQAAGTDAAERRQYLYHSDWRQRRDTEKFERMVAFARVLPRLRERVAEDLSQDGMPRERALACAVRLLDHAFFRVGSEAYTRQNGSFGLATVRKDHVIVRDKVVVFDFLAKSGKRHVHEISDPDVLPVLRTLKRRRNGGRELLAYLDGNRWRDVRSNDINEYVRETAGGEFTAKDFRTWHATVLAAVHLALGEVDSTAVTSRRRVVSGAVREVAGFLGNTPAVARASYIDPRVIARFERGMTIASTLERLKTDEPTDPVFRSAVEAAVLELIEAEDPGEGRAEAA
jgi:DNA topoisomerase I